MLGNSSNQNYPDMPIPAASSMSIKLDATFRDRLNSMATRHKRTSHAIARKAIETHVAREEAREALNQQALSSWNHFQETGLQVTGDDVNVWIESWGTKDELPPPKCRT